MNKKEFLLLLLTWIFGVIGFKIEAQQTQDSTQIYYNAITEFKDVNLSAKAFDFFQKKVNNALENNKPVKAAYNLELIAFAQYRMGFFDESEQFIIQALKLLDGSESNSQTQGLRERLFNQLGMIYRNLKDYENSNKYFKKALALNQNPENIIAIKTNIANNFADQEDYKKAVEVLEPLYEEAINIEDVDIKVVFIDNLGYYKTKIGDDSGEVLMNTALNLRTKRQMLTGLFSSYWHLSLLYLDRNDKVKAKRFIDSLEVIGNKIGTPSYQLEVLKLKLDLANNPDFKAYVDLKEAIANEHFARENKFAAIKYNVTEKEKELQEKEQKLKISELEKEKEKNLKLFYLALGLLVVFISGFLLMVLRIKHRKDKVKQVYLTEARISKKVHDEVANDVYQIMSKLQSTPQVNDDILDNLEAIYSKTRDISKENSAIDLKENFLNILKDLLQGYSNSSVNIITKGISQVEWEQVDDIKKMTLYRVLQELMVNMKKHSQASNVVLSFKYENNKIQIAYTDNGLGCNLLKGTGMQNMENRIHSINGTIIFESEAGRGFKSKITV
ncbi:tetratricopeptide repeat-containing sensor histidine kinase [Aestuariibaculum suncheonense]|uniref:histidine kinase n=1 Tax=Aestuariibaculum suncheonense TaxID=1028745 RepID=A0A8J6Q550_9FLAO|nr:tetratricopeptide repeat-containing sensor histidine kinase [Aestuariibaculum suncheonense]MBD0835283.1 tetratricopeptide repeat protein [Aestuariibaculum suncheonense]